MENFIPKSALAESLGVSNRTVELWIARRKFPVPRYLAGSRLAFFKVSDVEDWLERELSNDSAGGDVQ